MDDIPVPIPPQSAKFMDQLRLHIRAENKALATQKTYCFWVKRFILFHNKTHPKEMGKPEIESFLNYLANTASDFPLDSKNSTQCHHLFVS